jgi:hypothetical protein
LKTLPFVINDRRGQPKEPRPETVIEPEPEVVGDRSSWKSYAFYVVPMQTQGGVMMFGRAAGLRSDGQAFAGDYLLAPLWDEDFVWQKWAKKRLDTFLNCGCASVEKPCAIHQEYFKNWMAADSERVGAIANAPVPEAIEAYLKGEQSRQRIVAPGR